MLNNVRALPATTTLTPEQALQSAMQFSDLRQVIIIAEDGDGDLLIRSSRMTRADANWLLDRAKAWSLDVPGPGSWSRR